ncbi:MAG TPA: TlpA disulfide reductase family protein [Bryobacteraceae bacterium]|nr:TlpA disulfide reductase family protein [Bryobacteraceae bacterium]
MRRIFFIATLAALVSGAAFAQAVRRAPGFSLTDLNMAEHDLADYRGKIVLLDFMRTGCPHCIPFAKMLEGVKASYGGKVIVLAVVMPPDDHNQVAAFVDKTKITYPVLFDCGQAAYSYILPNALSRGEITTPHLYMIDANGIIRGDWVYGPQTTEIFEGKGLDTAIDKLLGKTK